MQLNFDATKFDPTQSDGGNLPVGKHPVVIINSEQKPTKENNAAMLVLTLQIIDGPQKGATGVYRLNLFHPNPQTVDIAHRQLSAVCHCIGVLQFANTQELHNKPFYVEVAMQDNAEAAAKGYTQVKRVYDINGNEPGKQPQQQLQGQAQAFQQPQQQAPAQAPTQAPVNAWAQPAQNPPQSQTWSQPAQQPAQQNNAGQGWQQPQNAAPQAGWAQPNQGNAAPPAWGKR